ncbi:Ca-activated chloride channel family protein [Malaciobacter marinus]|uniref:Ca-activated chloride channel family protein n=1 Tax=Malaciobacter marinus TaxID=505249 RepID=A0AB36ZVK4_9BACT|nr:VWA domain-containing protein [Malaciobacter marinus]PPK60111.1 Ca-activated chloride channel family protein [Malaciobacter marinus]
MQFLYPNVLFFMLIPTILLAFFITTNKKSMQKLFTQEALNKLTVNNKFMNQNTRNILFFIAVILMLIALGRPVIEPKEQELKQELISYTIALDTSKSMLADDIKPNRLTFAKNKLLKLLDLSKDKVVSVILFSNSSYILSPLTSDITSLKQIVSRIDEKYTFDNGSSLQVAIKSASKLLKNIQTKNLIILTDGTDKNSFEEEIKLAKDFNINIYIITTASKERTPIRLENGKFLNDENGNIVTVALNENIKNLSLNTNGAYINYTIDDYDIESIIKTVENNSKKQNTTSKKFKVYTELFYYPLALALLILLIAFSSLPKSRFLPFILILLIQYDLKASITDFKTIDKAQEAYEKKDYEKAAKEFKKVAKTPQAYYNLANSLYKQKKFKQALKNYKKVISSDESLEFKKLHNMGNSYTKLNQLEEAIRSYEKALKFKEDKQTRQNLDIVKDALKKQDSKKSNEKNNKQKNKNNKNNENKKQENDKQNSNQNQNTKNKKDEKNSSLKNSKNKETEKNKENKENKNEQKAENNKINNKEKKSQISKISEKEISNREEKKWLRQLEKNELEVFLKKDEESNEKTKW